MHPIDSKNLALRLTGTGSQSFVDLRRRQVFAPVTFNVRSPVSQVLLLLALVACLRVMLRSQNAPGTRCALTPGSPGVHGRFDAQVSRLRTLTPSCFDISCHARRLMCSRSQMKRFCILIGNWNVSLASADMPDVPYGCGVPIRPRKSMSPLHLWFLDTTGSMHR